MLAAPPSLLITDDDFAFRETLQGMLQPMGLRTLLAGDGEEALQIVGREDIHLILLDMHMPKLTGLETLQLVRQFDSVLPCILLSAGLDDLVIKRANELKAFSVLPKPVTRDQITITIRLALERTYGWAG